MGTPAIQRDTQDPFHGHSCRPVLGPTHICTQHHASQRLQLTLESHRVSANQGDIAHFGGRLKSRTERHREKNEHDLRCRRLPATEVGLCKGDRGGSEGQTADGGAFAITRPSRRHSPGIHKELSKLSRGKTDKLRRKHSKMSPRQRVNGGRSVHLPSQRDSSEPGVCSPSGGQE